MGGTLMVPASRLDQMVESTPELGALKGARVVFASGVTSVNIEEGGADCARHKAAVTAAASSFAAGVAHIFMVGDTSHKNVEPQLKEAGAIVVMVPRDEVGLARPYITAASLVDHCAGQETLYVKAEGDKNIAANAYNISALLEAGERYSVITGVRSTATWTSMPPYQAVTESILATAITTIARVPFDVASGVIALDAKGRELFRRRTELNDWGYLIALPKLGKHRGMGIGEAELTFTYPQDMVAAERNPGQDKKRREQLKLMLDRAVSLAGGVENLNTTQRQAYAAALHALDGLWRLAA